MTQRIVNVPTDKLLEVLITDLNEWPEEWGDWAVAALSNNRVCVWFCRKEPRPTKPAGWMDVGTVEVFLDALPCDHLYASVTREYWLAHGLKSPNRTRSKAVDGPVSVESQATQCAYYECSVDHPQNPSQGGVPYTPNCEDIIQALGLTFDEGCEFKSIWRRARARQGFAKAESDAVRDATKAVHYAQRVLAYEQRKANK